VRSFPAPIQTSLRSVRTLRRQSAVKTRFRDYVLDKEYAGTPQWVVVGSGPWFRQIRKQAREAARQKPIDRWLSLAGLAVTVLTSLVIPRTSASVIIGSVVAFVLLARPLWNFWWVEKTTRRRGAALAITALILGVIAYTSWPTRVPAPTTKEEIATEVWKRAPAQPPWGAATTPAPLPPGSQTKPLVSIACKLVGLPVRYSANDDINAIDTQSNGVGRVFTLSSDVNYWPYSLPPRGQYAFQCNLINHSPSALFAVITTVHFTLRQAVKVPDQPNSWTKGSVTKENALLSRICG
jgi:hypothetical protein